MPHINMFVLHTHKDNALSLETVGFYGIDPEASLEEFFRLKFEQGVHRMLTSHSQCRLRLRLLQNIRDSVP